MFSRDSVVQRPLVVKSKSEIDKKDDIPILGTGIYS